MRQQIAIAKTLLWKRFPRKPDGGVLFDGMDDWLWELYEGHRPRPSTLSWSGKSDRRDDREGHGGWREGGGAREGGDFCARGKSPRNRWVLDTSASRVGVGRRETLAILMGARP